MNIKSYVVASHLASAIFLFIVAALSSQGDLFINLEQYPSDLIVLLLFMLLGYFLTKWLISISPNISFLNILLSASYYYYAFGVFSDGYVAGWSHSTSVGDKLFIGAFICLVYFLTVFPPVIAVLVGVVHNLVIRKLCSFHQSKV